MYTPFSEMFNDAGPKVVVKFFTGVPHIASTHQTHFLPILITFAIPFLEMVTSFCCLINGLPDLR
jgi:hypothetical protein